MSAPPNIATELAQSCDSLTAKKWGIAFESYR